MPVLLPTMVQATLAKWLVKLGYRVASGEIIAELEIDKAALSFEASDGRHIGELVMAEVTDKVRVGMITALSLDDAGVALTSVPVAEPQAVVTQTSTSVWLEPISHALPLPSTTIAMTS